MQDVPRFAGSPPLGRFLARLDRMAMQDNRLAIYDANVHNTTALMKLLRAIQQCDISTNFILDCWGQPAQAPCNDTVRWPAVFDVGFCTRAA